MKQISCIVPIRKESRRIERKNFRDFNGKPLHSWTIEMLNSSNYIDKIYIDTNAEELSDFYENYPKISILKRPKELSSEFTSVIDLLKYDIQFIENEYILQTHVTNPLLTKKTLELAIKKFFEYLKLDYDSLFTVTRVFKRYWNDQFKPVNHNPKVLIRTQDLAPFYEENSLIYIFSKESLVKNDSRIGENPFLFQTPPNESFDIDEINDFMISEYLHKMRKKNV